MFETTDTRAFCSASIRSTGPIKLNIGQQEGCSQLAGGHKGSGVGMLSRYLLCTSQTACCVLLHEERPFSACVDTTGIRSTPLQLWGWWPCDEAPKETTGLSHQERSSMDRPGVLKELSNSLALAVHADRPSGTCGLLSLVSRCFAGQVGSHSDLLLVLEELHFQEDTWPSQISFLHCLP